MKSSTLRARTAALACAALLAGTGLAAGNWPGWRGPTGMGHSDEKGLPLTWDARTGKNVVWKVLLHGGGRKNPEMSSPGWSSPVVWGDRVFLTSAVWPEGLTKEERRKTIAAHHVLCYRASDGKQLWDIEMPAGKCVVDNHYHGYAVPTPATDGKHLFVQFGSGVVACLDFDGKIIWRKELPHRRDVDGGVCTSPVLYKDTVIVVGPEDSSLLALDRKTGEQRWKQQGRERGRMATPVLLRIGGKTQLVHCAGGVTGFDPDSGEKLWTCRAQVSYASPVYGGGLVYVDAGRGGQTGTAIDPTGTGDVSKTHVKWQAKIQAAGGSSAIIVGDYLYRANGSSVLRCWKAATGELVYEERLQRISQAASPIATADGRIYFAGSGRSFVIKAGPKFELLATNDLGEGNDFVAPAVSGGRLFIRGKSYLWCIGNKE